MHSQLTAELRARGNLLLQGRIDELLDTYIFPLPVFMPEQRLLLTCPDQAHALFTLLHAWLKRTGVVSVQPEVQAVELPRSGRFRVWVDWQERIMPSAETRVSQLGPRIEMVNYTRLSMPELHQEFEALALSA
jgi:hypothetical protein